MPSERLSVVVLFNHNASPGDAAEELVAAFLGIDKAEPPASVPMPAWLGTYIEPETGLSVRIEAANPSSVSLHYGAGPKDLVLQADGTAGLEGTRLRPGPDGLWLDVPEDNQSSLLMPRQGSATPDIAGRYHCVDLGADLTIADAGGQLYGACSGVLGDGRMELLEPLGLDLWVMPCPRGVDHFPPGDWTLAFTRDAANRIAGIQLGCWLARRFSYARQS